MKPRVLWHIAWAALATAAIVASTVTRLPFDPGAVVWPLGLVAYPMAAALILIHREGNRVGQAMAVVGVTAGVMSAADWFSLKWGDSVWSPYLEVLGLPAFAIVYWGLVAILYLFPTGVTIPGWRRWLFGVFTVVALGLISLGSIVTVEVLPTSGEPNPWHIEGLNLDGGPAALVVMGVGAVGGISSVVRRFRRSAGVERAQMKVFLTGAVAFVVILGIALGLDEPVDPNDDPLWSYFIVTGGLLAVPTAITAAILRYRLYDIDRLVRRTVSYALVVSLLAGVFFGVVTVLTSLLPTDSDLAIAASTLAVAALFNPLRRRVQKWVDRRFNRSRYDAQREIDSLSDRLRDAHDLDEITGEALHLVNKTMQPIQVGVWVRDS